MTKIFSKPSFQMHIIFLLLCLLILTSIWSLVEAQDSSEVLSQNVMRGKNAIPVLIRSSDDVSLADAISPFLGGIADCAFALIFAVVQEKPPLLILGRLFYFAGSKIPGRTLLR
jgi:hypothetical protein